MINSYMYVYLYVIFTDADLQCLGTWQDDGKLYMMGKLVGEGFVSKELQYRCFVSVYMLIYIGY